MWLGQAGQRWVRQCAVWFGQAWFGWVLCNNEENDMSTNHRTPRMGNRPLDPAYALLHDSFVSTPKVKRDGCYICADMEYARMGLPLCTPCCNCRANGSDGHIPADDNLCDDCGHEACQACGLLPAQAEPICTCATPCCEVDVGIGYVMTCGSQHCPTHGNSSE